MLHILDRTDHRTDSREKLSGMLASREALSNHDATTSLNVMNDKGGFILALGTAVPMAYRVIIREQNYLDVYDINQLENDLGIPSEFVEFVIASEFESLFETARNEAA